MFVIPAVNSIHFAMATLFISEISAALQSSEMEIPVDVPNFAVSL